MNSNQTNIVLIITNYIVEMYLSLNQRTNQMNCLGIHETSYLNL